MYIRYIGYIIIMSCTLLVFHKSVILYSILCTLGTFDTIGTEGNLMAIRYICYIRCYISNLGLWSLIIFGTLGTFGTIGTDGNLYTDTLDDMPDTLYDICTIDTEW